MLFILAINWKTAPLFQSGGEPETLRHDAFAKKENLKLDDKVQAHHSYTNIHSDSLVNLQNGTNEWSFRYNQYRSPVLFEMAARPNFDPFATTISSE
jgi:hypothetical protein